MSRVSLAMRRAIQRPERERSHVGGDIARLRRPNPIESVQRMAGNHVVGELLRQWAAPRGRELALDDQPRRPREGSELEAEADRLAAPRSAEERGPARDRPADGSVTRPQDASVAGDTVPGSLRRDFENRLGIDLSRVRVHHDGQAAQGADAVDARAVTVGRNVYFARGEYAPGTAAGRHLLGHELTHVAQQQQSGVALQRQARGRIGPKVPDVPKDLQQSLDLSKLSDDALTERHDRILDVLAQFTESTPDTDALVDEAAHIGTELARRRALAAGRTFSGDAIDRMRAYFEANAKKPRRPAPGTPTPEPAGGWQEH